MPTVALVMSRSADDLGGEVAALTEALAAVGITAAPEPWGDDGVDWSRYDAAVVRGAHDYIEDPEAFAAWADSVATVTRLANPAPLLRWNTDKRYLRDLADLGVPVVPTVWVEPGDAGPPEIPAAWGEVVVKPAVGVAGIGASRFEPDRRAAAAARAEEIAATGVAAMIQPFLVGVEGEGETGTYLFGGEPSHAIRKHGQLRPGAAPFASRDEVVLPDVTARPLDAVLIALARQALAAAPAQPGDILYARVDTVPSPTGPLLIELEVFEPWLFLELVPEAAGRFAAAVDRWLRS